MRHQLAQSSTRNRIGITRRATPVIEIRVLMARYPSTAVPLEAAHSGGTTWASAVFFGHTDSSAARQAGASWAGCASDGSNRRLVALQQVRRIWRPFARSEVPPALQVAVAVAATSQPSSRCGAAPGTKPHRPAGRRVPPTAVTVGDVCSGGRPTEQGHRDDLVWGRRDDVEQAAISTPTPWSARSMQRLRLASRVIYSASPATSYGSYHDARRPVGPGTYLRRCHHAASGAGCRRYGVLADAAASIRKRARTTAPTWQWRPSGRNQTEHWNCRVGHRAPAGIRSTA